MKPSLKIGILGTRGIPNHYGGYEQFGEYLSKGLVTKGHKVWVYCSSHHPYQAPEWNGVQLIHCTDPESRLGTFGQFIYDLNCFTNARKRGFDILLQLGYTSNSVWFFLWPKRSGNIVNMDGLEWKRSKYNKPTQAFLRYAERLAALHADILIADSVGIQEHLRSVYNKSSVYIPYGAEVIHDAKKSLLTTFGLLPNEYHLLIARQEPENNIEMVIRGYLASEKMFPLVIVGNTGNTYGTYLKSAYKDPAILFVGGIYDQEVLNALRYYCRIYFHGHSVGGTNPSLLEAMACGCTIAANDTIFNKAILGSDGYYFSSPENVTSLLQEKEPLHASTWKQNNTEKIKNLYNWDAIIAAYEQVFLDAHSEKIKR